MAGRRSDWIDFALLFFYLGALSLGFFWFPWFTTGVLVGMVASVFLAAYVLSDTVPFV